MKMRSYLFILLFATGFTLSGCVKEFLDEKPRTSMVIPTKLSDFRALLDDPQVFIYNSASTLAVLSTDDYVAPDSYIKTLSDMERGTYLWEKDLAANASDWFYAYQQVFKSNIVLDELPKVDDSEKKNNEYRYIEGSALFWRSYAFFNLLGSYSKPYNELTADADPGIPLRLTSDVNIKVKRGTTREGFKQIIDDLKTAVELLPVSEKHKSRPTRNAALALLARVYLTMRNFKEAGNYANQSLEASHALLEYRLLDSTAVRPFPLALTANNPEIILYTAMLSYGFLNSTLVGIDPDLYMQYEQGDLRRVLYFENNNNGQHNFKGNYSGDSYLFAGLTTREQYLIRAECYARDEKTNLAMNDLNTLLKTRWDDRFVPLTATTPNEALKLILKERRKELVGQGLRFPDLRRLNLEPDNAVTLKRVYNGEEILLPPNDNRYVFLIPEDEIRFTGIEQNSRQ